MIFQKGNATPSTFEWHNLGYLIKDKPILANISGSVSSGEMLASKSNADS